MSLSLRTKIAIFVTLTIFIFSAISTYLFVSQHKHHIEKEFNSRGITLGYLLSKIAAEGLAAERLDLISRASFIINAEDVIRADVYTEFWDIIESYPSPADHKDPLLDDVTKYFSGTDNKYYINRDEKGQHFFHKVMFQPYENSASITIGYVMVDLSTSHMQKAIDDMIKSNIIMSLIITFVSVLALNILIRRLIGKPVMDLHNSVRMFKNGAIPEIKTAHSLDEIGDLAREFNEMSRTIKDKEYMLAESAKRMRSIFERVEHAIFRLDKDGQIIDCNSKFTQMFGHVERLCDIFITGKTVNDYFRNGGSKNAVHVEEKVVGKYGSELTVALSLYADTDDEGGIKNFDGYMVDITERKRAEEKISLAAKVMESTLEGIFITDSEFNITAVNPSFNVITGLSYAEVKGRNPAIMAAGNYDIETYRQILGSIKTGTAWQGEIKNRRKNGEAYLTWLNISAIKDNNGKITNYVGVFTDITQRKLTEDHLKFRANHDILTGLPNKALFNELLIHAVEQAKRDRKKLAVMFLDLDNFKAVNDTHGHDVGDLLLQEAAKKLKECVRQSDTVSRLSGDEFAVILNQLEDISNAVLVAQKILLAHSHPFYPGGNEVKVGVSIGISLYPEDGGDAETLLKNSDTAMYLTKNSGKNSYRLFSENTTDDSDMIE